MELPQFTGQQDAATSSGGVTEDQRWTRLSVSSLILLLASVIIVALPASPRFMSFPGRDSGVFLYVGSKILNGNIPYRDVWDHKSPGIYYLNALGLWLSNGSLWGVWGLEVVCWGIALSACFWLLHTAFNLRTAILGSIAFLGGIILILQGGSIRGERFVTGSYSGTNLTESYALCFQLGALALMFAAERRHHYGWRGPLIGASSGFCFLLRPNLIAIPLAMVTVIAVTSLWQRQWHHLLRAGASIAVGGFFTIAGAVAYFASQGVLEELLDAAFRYNSVYIQKGSHSALEGVMLGFRILGQSGIGVIALVGIGFGIALLPRSPHPLRCLIAVVLFAIPFELLFSTMSGRNFAHYYLSWLPIAALLVGLTVFGAERALGQFGTARLSRLGITLTAAAMSIAMGLVPISTLYRQYQREDTSNLTRMAVADYITERTSSDDYVLIWGAESSVNVMAQRSSPTRYVYQYPLYLTGYQRPSMVEVFLEELETNPPRMIIDASASTVAIPPIDATFRAAWLDGKKQSEQAYYPLPEMERVYRFVHSNYVLTDTVVTAGNVTWGVYELIETATTPTLAPSQITVQPT